MIARGRALSASRHPFRCVLARSTTAGGLAFAALALAPIQYAHAETPGSATATGTASATVVAPLTVTADGDLDFGTLTSGNTPGSVTLGPLTASASYSGGVQAICAAACAPPHPARFSVKGEPDRSYLVTAPRSVTIAPQASGGGTALVDAITVATSSRRSEDGRGVLDHQGADRFEVGGTLHLAAQATAGHYIAQVPVTVTYY